MKRTQSLSAYVVVRAANSDLPDDNLPELDVIGELMASGDPKFRPGMK